MAASVDTVPHQADFSGLTEETGPDVLSRLGSRPTTSTFTGLTEETGLAVLSRLGSRPSLDSLLPDLLPPPFPQNTQVTWSGGAGESNAVTSFLVDLMVTAALPKSQKGIAIGGCGAGIILLNTDHHVKVRSVAKHMEARVKQVADAHYRKLTKGERTRENRLTSSDQWEIVKASLERIHIMEVFTPSCLEISIISISNILSGNNNIACVILDSISAFYYQVRCSHNVNYSNYAKRVLSSLNNAVKNTNTSVKVVYTMHDYFKQGMDDLARVRGDKGAFIEIGLVEEEGKIKQVGLEEEKIKVEEEEDNTKVFSVVSQCEGSKKEKKFTLDNLGHIKWK